MRVQDSFIYSPMSGPNSDYQRLKFTEKCGECGNHFGPCIFDVEDEEVEVAKRILVIKKLREDL